jgi:sugar-specific transcriptional regulator TrmB
VNLGPDEVRVFEAVLASPGSCGTELAHDVQLRRGVVLAVLRLLRARGLVQAVPCPRRRVEWFPRAQRATS